MNVKCLEFNFLPVNTYVVWDDTNECAIIDPGCFYPGENGKLAGFIQENNLKVKFLLNTHLHFDHVFGNTFVENTYSVKAHGNDADNPWIETISKRLAVFGMRYEGHVNPILPENVLREGDIIQFGNTTLHVMHIPGHSPGSLVFHNRKDKILFSGDVLFQNSIGRTDFPDSDGPALISGIRRKLLTLDPSTAVFPGHGPATTIEQEKHSFE
ncbi:MAG: MBL fold metallo-hydrolase [Bacteroidaceae bacterium]|nr:MBL fold metallo-hydrolase [Bacteroidaceae bacterium]